MLGYSRYQDFRADMIAYLAKKNERTAQDTGHLDYFNTLYELLREAEKLLTAERMEELLRYIDGFDRVFATGTGKSYHPAQLLQILSYKTGRNIQALPKDMLFEAGDYIGENDLLIIFMTIPFRYASRRKIGMKYRMRLYHSIAKSVIISLRKQAHYRTRGGE